ncbi:MULTISPECIES: GNAT family N-acetyltransferase [unclassified Streptomyces]|uniref:GNAT family N-acetyltransferase n=1 Tax=unclassified Streptomyces TaxID=2593676 RepID=UPI00225527AB|nr:GNAT family N-acetyltransferase [Streptomyces sp. NBC_00340]MCX5133780.1 GNAT family N-acetyltransferase [Streptomyces sp. NBC_00340]
MTGTDQQPVSTSLRIDGKDAELEQRLDDELTAFNAAATGAGAPEPLSVRVTDAEGALVGGLTAWVWGSCCAVDMLWVRADQRHAGWGGKLLRAAEEEGARRGCTEVIVSSFTFQAPDFYRGHGYRETGRTEGIPGGHEDVHFHKVLAG